ncbi:MAG: DUF3352 domain-containing protein [Dehalococcoidia bacterium]
MRFLRIGIPVAASALVVSAIVIALWMIGSASGERAKFSSLEVAPKDTEVFFAINTDPTSPQWLAVNDSLEAINAKGPIREAIDQALAEFDLEWERDITPIAGDEAFFSVPSIEGVNDEGGFVAGFLIADEDKAQDVFDDLRTRAEDEGEKLLEEDYEGVTIHYTEEAEFSDALSSASSGAVALFDEVLAIGGSADDVKSVIDVVQGRAPSAEENERLQEFREAQEGDFLMWGYADVAKLWDLAESGLATSVGMESGGSTPVEVAPEPEETVPGDFTITSFDSEYEVDPAGYLYVTERIVVDFGPIAKHGIFRDLATISTYDAENDELIGIETTAVSRDGQEEPYEETYNFDSQLIKIGDPDVTIEGEHVYEIRYTVYGGVHPADDGASYKVYWNVTGEEWGVPIGSSSATVTADGGEIVEASCWEGPFGFIDPCESTFDATTAHFATTGALPPGSGLTFAVTLSGPSTAEPLLVPSGTFSDEGEGFPSDEGGSDELPFEIDTEQLFEQLRGTYDRVGFSVSSTSDGFAFDVTVLHAPGFEPELAFEPTAAFESHFAESVPADTMFYFAGYDIYGQNWLPARAYFEDVEFSDGKTLDDFLDEFADETGLDLEDDILSLLTGEYAVAGDISGWEQDTPDFNFLALLDVADATKAQGTLDDLGAYLDSKDIVRVDDDEPIQRWTFLDQDEIQAIGVTVNGDVVIAGYPTSVVEDVVNGLDEPLASTQEWQRTVGLLPADTTSIGFVSLARILDEARKGDDFEQSLEEETNGEITLDDLDAIRSFGYATTIRENGFGVHFVLFVKDR